MPRKLAEVGYIFRELAPIFRRAIVIANLVMAIMAHVVIVLCHRTVPSQIETIKASIARLINSRIM
jgi:hypothetical protein